MKRIVVGITGASGAIYGRTLVQRLADHEVEVELVVSAAGERVARAELDVGYGEAELRQWLGEAAGRVRRHPASDIGATIASGSYPVGGMVVAPCTMGTAGRIAAGLSGNLIERAADVQLKERRPLVLLIRESPLSAIHLENLLRLARAGTTVLPAAPGFYHRPATIEQLVEFLLERVETALGIDRDRSVRWQGDASS